MTETESHYEKIDRDEWLIALIGNVETEKLKEMLSNIDDLINLGLIVHYLYDPENGTATYTATPKPKLGFHHD